MWHNLKCLVLSVGLLLPLAKEAASKPKGVPHATSRQATHPSPDKVTPAMLHGKIVFVQGADLWCINADGSGRTKILEKPFGDYELGIGPDLDFSPDLSHLVLVYRQPIGDGFYGYELVISRVDGTQRKVLVKMDGTEEYKAPRFNADGSKILYEEWSGAHIGGPMTATADIWLINPDGSHNKPLIDDPTARTTVVAYHGALWSRDGRRIFYWQADGGFPEESYVPLSDKPMSIRIDGTDPRPATDHDSQFLFDDLSPDGRQRVIVRSKGKHPDDSYGDLYIQNTNGSRSRRLFSDDKAEKYGEHFSPDGKHIIFNVQQEQSVNGRDINDYSIWIVNTDGSGLRCLVKAGQFAQWLR